MMNEEQQWNAACNWVCEQVLITFRHRACLSRLEDTSFASNDHGDNEWMLEIELPKELKYETSPSEGIIQTIDKVRLRLKELEELEKLEKEIEGWKLQRRLKHIPFFSRSSRRCTSNATTSA